MEKKNSKCFKKSIHHFSTRIFDQKTFEENECENKFQKKMIKC